MSGPELFVLTVFECTLMPSQQQRQQDELQTDVPFEIMQLNFFSGIMQVNFFIAAQRGEKVLGRLNLVNSSSALKTRGGNFLNKFLKFSIKF